MSSSVVSGSSLDTRYAAPSCSATVGPPLAEGATSPAGPTAVMVPPRTRTQVPGGRKAWPSKTVPLWKMISSSVIDTATSGEPGGSSGETQSLAYGYVNVCDKIYDSHLPLLSAIAAGGPLRFLELDDDGHDPY